MQHTLLCLDTSTRHGSVALAHRGRVETRDIHPPHTQAGELLPAIESALHGHGIWYDALEALAITVGPGSFTGLRIGLATARGIAFMHPALRVYGFTTLECLAAGYEGSATTLYATLKAGKGDIYGQWFDCTASQLRVRDAVALVTPPAPAPQPGASSPARAAIVGNTAELTGWSDYAAPETPHAGHLLKAMARLSPIPERALKPLYIRPPDAKLPSG